MSAKQASLAALSDVANGLKELNNEVTFVGGATLCLYIDDPAFGDVRHTEDVDCVLEVVGQSTWHALESRLRALGFVHHPTSDVICRWLYRGIAVDFMPATSEILGFTNRWYLPGIQARQKHVLPDGSNIWTFTFPHFFASKLEAFAYRGAADPIGSKDCEDLIAMLDGRLTALTELRASDQAVRSYIAENIKTLFLQRPGVMDLIRGHLLPAAEHQARAPLIWQMMENLGA